ncbi:MAG: VWA domain-containing protein [Anaerolineales bacterium]
MKKLTLLLLVCTSLLALVPQAALADGMILPLTLDAGYLAVRYHHVTVEIDDHHAVTRVEQEFYNPHDIPIDGRYLFPVPPDAIISNFTAEVDGEPQQVTRQDGAATNRALFTAVEAQHDPTLLQYADWETLAFDLNLPAGGSRKMTLTYEEVLIPSGGMLHYHYVLGTERYSALPLDEVSVEVDLRSSSGLGTLYAASHDVTVERREEGRARVSWSAEHVRPTEDFDLFFAPADGGFGSGLLTGEREEQEHLLFLFAPETVALQEESLPKDIVFVIDRSGSMQGEKMSQAQNALQFILGQLNPGDRFSIVAFDDRLEAFSSQLRPADGVSLREARSFVEALYANASTDIEGALQTGLGVFEQSEVRPGVPRLLVFLTDGLPTAGITDERLIADLIGSANAEVEARLHVFGVGYDVNTHLLDRLSGENGGSVTYVQPDESLETVLSNFYQRIANPVLTDVTLEFEGLVAEDLYPRQLPDLFQDSNLLVTGRYRAQDSEITVRVRGRAGERIREYVYTFDLEESRGYDFVPRLWATRRVGELLDRVRVEGESAALIEEIRALGLGYGIVTPYTTFVVAAQADGAASLENMSLYDRGSELNQAFGEVTIQARVQNQAYQGAAQANLATGANVVHQGRRSLAQIASQSIDLTLLQAYDPAEGPITDAWIAANVQVDRQVTFASEEYFALAADPAVRPLLQSGSNVIFEHEGEVIAVEDPDAPVAEQPNPDSRRAPSQQTSRSSLLETLLKVLERLSQKLLSK